jgi:PGM1 C-terminal domain
MQVRGALSEPASVGATLADLDEEQRSERFGDLQRHLITVWSAMRSGQEGESIVVVPSRTVDRLDEPAAEAQAYEERLLFLLLLLRQPRLRLIYVTSLPIAPDIIDYYLGLLQGVIPGHAVSRLSLVAACDGSARPLSEKLLERPRLIERIRRLIPDPALSHLVPYSTTVLERDLSLLLGIPMYGADPRFDTFGTKTGCRRLFAQEGVAHPFGSEDLDSLEGVVASLAELRSAKPQAAEALVKLNEGVSGRGNALVDLRELPAPGSVDELDALRRRVESMTFEAPSVEHGAYMAQLGNLGGVVEERIVGAEFRSPSVQLRVTPGGEVEILSTHDQLLGGPSGQSYLGCRFPADPAYAATITEMGERVGGRLAREGVLGRFALDFVSVRNGAAWDSYAIEINLRKGGTTHPYLTLEFLTEGRYEPESATFRAPNGRAKFLVATDHLESELFRGLTRDDLFDMIVRHGLQFDHARQTGVIFHMLSALTELGRTGLTSVGDTPDEAQETYTRAEALLLEEAEAALSPLALP